MFMERDGIEERKGDVIWWWWGNMKARGLIRELTKAGCLGPGLLFRGVGCMYKGQSIHYSIPITMIEHKCNCLYSG
jgi:hypothetical protein